MQDDEIPDRIELERSQFVVFSDIRRRKAAVWEIVQQLGDPRLDQVDTGGLKRL